MVALKTKKDRTLKERFKRTDFIKNWQYYLMLLPTVGLFFVFTYMAMPGILLAFQKDSASGIFGNEWVGFDNFVAFFSGPYFLRCTINTVIINFSNLIFGTIASITFAILINELISQKSKKIYQNILFLPTFFSVLLVSRFISLLLDNEKGLVNSFLEVLGFDAIMFYNTPGLWVGIVVIAYIWKGVGYNLIVYLANISGIDKSIYEAAEIDGAGRWNRIWYITIPMLIPTIIILVLFNIGRIFFGDFQLIFTIIGTTNYALMESLDIIETYLFRSVTGANPDYAVSGAVSLFQSALGFIMIFGSNLLVKLYNKDYALF